MNSRVVRVGGGSGMWGDDLDAPRRLVEGGPLDYLILDYLAEVTMSVLQRQKDRDPAAGYARDIVGAVESVLPALIAKKIKVVANAGGVNPRACADAVLAMFHDQGLPVLKHASFGTGVNVTLGLPIVRTSVDHGTALDLAGTGRADPGSLLAALALAQDLAGLAVRS